MRRNRVVAKKPAILKDKIILAQYIKKNWVVSDFDEFRNYKWHGDYQVPGTNKIIHVYFQYYVNARRRVSSYMGVNYVDMYWVNSSDALTTREIKNLIREYCGVE